MALVVTDMDGKIAPAAIDMCSDYVVNDTVGMKQSVLKGDALLAHYTDGVQFHNICSRFGVLFLDVLFLAERVIEFGSNGICVCFIGDVTGTLHVYINGLWFSVPVVSLFLSGFEVGRTGFCVSNVMVSSLDGRVSESVSLQFRFNTPSMLKVKEDKNFWYGSVPCSKSDFMRMLYMGG